MWIVSGNSLQMAEGDFGLLLPVKINGTTLTRTLFDTSTKYVQR